MDKSRFEGKVGLFVFVGLVLLAALLIQFSKGTSLFRKTYELRLRAANVGSLKARSAVLMSGVQVGSVSDIKLNPAGTNVVIFVSIYKEYVIHKDARFIIEQSGFLGDQYVSIVPTKNLAEPFADKDTTDIQEPFNLQEVARSASGFIQRIDETAAKLNEAISDVRRLVLNEQTLTNLAVTVNTMRTASERALTTVDGINGLFATNGPAISYAASNVVVFSENLDRFADSLNDVVATNRETISVAVKNIEASTATFKALMDDVQAGKGAAGTLLRDERVASQVADIANNLSTTTSNLNRLGLWGILWSKKPPKTNPPPMSVRAPKTPF
jgi:ABC-type transporter Mla subunit MlaD